jgi:DNA-binding NtrC family response regulator
MRRNDKPATAPGDNVSVPVVDDDAPIRTLLRQQAKADVEYGSDGEVTLARLRSHSYSVVILDQCVTRRASQQYDLRTAR